ncbi:MAG: helix-turn-helix domain-containing protein [Phycisphaerales bacterium]
MKLADYLDQNDLTPGDLRRLLGVKSRSTVMRYLSGERRPSPGIMSRIRELTGGAVSPVDFTDPAPPRCARIVMGPDGQPRHVLPWTITPSARPGHANDDARPCNHASRATVRWRRCARLPRGHDPDAWPSLPLREAMEVLGPRVMPAKRGGFLLDGRLTDTRGVVAAANRWLREHDRPLIPYPGVEPLE